MTTTSRSADPARCAVASVTAEQARTRSVRDMMVKNPKTLDFDATVDDARQMFTNPRVREIVLVNGAAYAGLLSRDDVPRLVSGSAAVRTWARRDTHTIVEDRPMAEALQILEQTGLSRLAVLRADGVSLAGLLCLDSTRSGFCQD